MDRLPSGTCRRRGGAVPPCRLFSAGKTKTNMYTVSVPPLVKYYGIPILYSLFARYYCEILIYSNLPEQIDSTQLYCSKETLYIYHIYVCVRFIRAFKLILESMNLIGLLY